ncbi:hypothetical protein FGU65_09210 [Methanoculleus sp. FWC-SCC1]|uniref:Uncharacterized protein n=1 Tax=Methanoculleus frigidifontis TaxID=2584085 RepID=A0ABT8MAU1_9EURY|nr:hypothetical protein [Methanoculleus sp. FWC-SCC1]MDN7025062.1 hypothetical protein [Methanoculleus sp. FWC-SCC1]
MHPPTVPMSIPDIKDSGVAAPNDTPPKNNKIPTISNIHGTLSIVTTVAVGYIKAIKSIYAVITADAKF